MTLKLELISGLDVCNLCFTENGDDIEINPIHRYPRKVKKKAARKEGTDMKSRDVKFDTKFRNCDLHSREKEN
jgi:hypothetical protein